MGLDLHRLQFLRELAARGTITATAKALAYTPSAVSQQLSTLEKELGIRLLERRGRAVVLTAAGRALADEADDVFRAAERASVAAEVAASALTGPVHVGAFPSVGTTLIPSAFASLRRSHPELEVHFGQWDEHGIRELKLGHLDICVDQRYSILPSIHEDQLVEHELLVEPVCLAVADADDRGPDPAAYRDDIWAGGTADGACGQLLRAVCNAAGFEPEVRFHTDDLEVISELTASGLAVAVLPRLAAYRFPAGVTIHPLEGTERRVLAMTRAEARGRPAVDLVVDELRRAGATVAQAINAATMAA